MPVCSTPASGRNWSTAGKVDTNKVNVFATTPAYFDYNWTVRGTLDPALAAKIKKAFLDARPGQPRAQGDS